MSDTILLNRKKFFFNKEKRSSHIQFLLQSDKKMIQEDSFNIKFSDGFKTVANFNNSNNYYDVVYKQGKRKLYLSDAYISIANNIKRDISGTYQETGIGTNTYAMTNICDDQEITYYISQYKLKQSETNSENNRIRNWYIGSIDVTNENSLQEAYLFFKSAITDGSLIPPHVFYPYNDEATTKYYPKVIWINNDFDLSPSNLSMQITDFKKNYEYPKRFYQTFYICAQNEQNLNWNKLDYYIKYQVDNSITHDYSYQLSYKSVNADSKLVCNNGQISKIDDVDYNLQADESLLGTNNIKIELHNDYPFSFIKKVYSSAVNENSYKWVHNQIEYIYKPNDELISNIRQYVNKDDSSDIISITFDDDKNILKINDDDYVALDITNNPSSLNQSGIIIDKNDYSYNYPISFDKCFFQCKKNTENDTYYWDKISDALVSYKISEFILNSQDKSIESVKYVPINSNITIQFENKTNIVSKINNENYISNYFNEIHEDNILNQIKYDVEIDLYPDSLVKKIYVSAESSDNNYYWEENSQINYIYKQNAFDDDQSKLAIRTYYNKEDSTDLINVEFGQNEDGFFILKTSEGESKNYQSNAQDYNGNVIDTSPSALNQETYIITINNAYDISTGLSTDIQFILDDYETLNSDNYTGQIPDSVDDSISYNKGKILNLNSLTNDQNYDYSLKIFKINDNNESYSGNNNFAQRISFDDTANVSYTENYAFSQITGKVFYKINDTDDQEYDGFASHICKNYIVEANFVSNGSGDGNWIFKLFEAVKYGKQHLTFQYLKSLTGSTSNFTYINDKAQSVELDDINYKINYDETTGMWYIISLNETQTQDYDDSISDYNFQFPVKKDSQGKLIGAYASQGKLIGAIVDFNYYDVSNGTQKALSNNNVSVTLNEVSCYRYRLFIGNNWKLNFINYIGKNYHYNSSELITGLIKGKLLDIQYTGSYLFGSIIKFKYDQKNIFNFQFTSNAVSNAMMLEFVVCDTQFDIPCNLGKNTKSFNFNLNNSDNDHKIQLTGAEIMNYLNDSNDLYYLNDDYKFMVVVYDKNGDLCLPYINKQQIIYFQNNLNIDFGDNSKTYIKSSNYQGVFSFSLQYQYIINNVSNYKSINNHKIPFNTIQVSDSNGAYDNITNDTNFDDYPFKWNNVIFSESFDDISQNERLYFSDEDNQYSMSLPFGDLLTERQYIIIPSTPFINYGVNGNYRLMTYKQVNAALSTSYTYDTYYEYQTNKIYKYTNTDTNISYYLKYSDGWRIVSDISTTTKYIILSSDKNKTDVCQAFNPTYYYNNTSSYKNNGVAVQKIAAESENGQYKNLYIRLTDKYGNITNIQTGTMAIHQTYPDELNLRIIGSNGSNSYTGFYKKYGRFFPSEFVTLQFSASSSITMKYRLSGNIMIVKDKENEWYDLPNSSNCNKIVKLKPITEYKNLLGNDELVTIKLQVKDAAGNISTTSSSIKYISKLFRTQNQHLISQSSAYSHTLYSQEGSVFNRIIQSRISTTQYTRSWNQIWFPSNHGVPLNQDGTIDEVNALRISKEYDSSGVNGPTSLQMQEYDKLTLDATGDALSTDSEGRFIQNMSKWDTTKTYSGMINSQMKNNSYDTYWIIDNTGNIDFKLQFQVFDFNQSITTIPANLSAPYDGDMLCVYDASDEDAVIEKQDQYGNKKYELKDSTKLNLLFTLKGSYLDKDVSNTGSSFSMIDSQISGSLVANGNYGFVTPSISSCSRICLVPFTDYGQDNDSVGSGFKLKAGPKHAVQYVNYQSIEDTGQFWVHISPEVVTGKWKSCDVLALNYSYYGSYATTNYDEGTITFNERLTKPLLSIFNSYLYLNNYNNKGSYPYSYFSYYYNYDNNTYITQDQKDGYDHCIKSFITTQDDMVDYTQPTFYVVDSGLDLPNNNIYDFSKYTLLQSGKLSSGYSLQKDTGILTFSDIVPIGRFLSSYYYHTFYRLTSDGYGDLYFYGTGVLVPAAQSTEHSDWAYVDLKIVNEGTNTLNSGKLQFLARGYISKGSVVDTVLDQNRPWDVQQGTTAETVNRTGATAVSSYSSLPAANRKNAVANASTQTCSLGTLASKSQVFVRVFWCIATDENGTSWIQCTRGTKCFSAQLSGLYYIFTTGV